MNRDNNSWQKLVAAAQLNPAGDEMAPFGFATRVAAQAFAAELAVPPVLERFARRGLIAAIALSLAAVAFGYSSMAGESDEDLVVGDTVGEMLAMATH